MGIIYLGDSVYASANEFGQIELWLDNGDGPKNKIVLEQPVMEALIRMTKAAWGPEWSKQFGLDGVR